MSYYRYDRYDDYDDAPDADACGGSDGGCDGCEHCTEDVRVTRKVIARAPRSDKGRERRARNQIKPGDTITVTTGFEYQTGGGPRMGYFRHERLVEPGPAWNPVEAEAWRLSQRALRCPYFGCEQSRKLLADVLAFEQAHPHGPEVKWANRKTVVRPIAKQDEERKALVDRIWHGNR